MKFDDFRGCPLLKDSVDSRGKIKRKSRLYCFACRFYRRSREIIKQALPFLQLAFWVIQFLALH